jgi:hypothetical protein
MQERRTVPAARVIRYHSVNEVLELHSRVMQASGGSLALLDLGALESAVAQSRVMFES